MTRSKQLKRSLPSNKPGSLPAKTKPTREPGVVVGLMDGQPFRLSPRDQSMGEICLGAAGSGKTSALFFQIQQKIDHGAAFGIIDPHSDLVGRSLSYCAYKSAIGCKLPKVIPFDPSGHEWVLPFNPFEFKAGDVAAAVDHRVQATLRAWGQSSSDQTPRLEKWLKCFYTVLIEGG